jgi:opacity protein-like surface antigen
MKKMILAAAASAAILTSTAFAMEDQFYVKVEGGATMLNNTKVNGLKMKSNTAGIFGAGVGYYVMENVRTELTLDFIVNPRSKHNSLEGKETLRIKQKGDVASLLLNGYVDLYDAGAFKFYAGAGVGVAQVRAKFTSALTITGGSTEQKSVKTKKATNFAYQVGAGASAAVAEGVKVELGYSWRDYGKTKSKIVDGEALGKTHYRGHNIIAGVRFDI